MRALFLLLLLTGCVSPEQRQARMNAEAAAIDYQKKVHCANMGAPEGSKNYYDCRKSIEDKIFASQMQMMQGPAPGSNAMMGVANDSYYAPGYGPPPGMRCTTKPDMFGTSIITDCR